jgi:hypothetical protein
VVVNPSAATMITTAAAAANMNNSQLALTGQAQVANEGEKIYKQWCVMPWCTHTPASSADSRLFTPLARTTGSL